MNSSVMIVVQVRFPAVRRWKATFQNPIVTSGKPSQLRLQNGASYKALVFPGFFFYKNFSLDINNIRGVLEPL
jgi:hypothetical protein